ncbi:MAG TPA: M14 family zinc carboxypeptidase [Solirubrobacter sp.]|nr:M14 family zinc carboxypeptidase [Solirubrobacter sp.]
MVGKRAATVAAATALLLAGASSAYGSDNLPGGDTALVRVTVPSQVDVDRLVESYDVVEYKHVEDDGSISLNIDTTAAERSALRTQGYTIGRTVENATTRANTAAERDATRAAEALAGNIAKTGVTRGVKLEGRSVVPVPGETVIQRANTFTNYAGRFLYVEAHNKGVIQTGTGNGTGRTLALSFAGADGVFSAPTNMGIFRDTDPNPDVYMYHRQLIRLTGDAANIPADQMTVRVAAVATDGSTTSTDTYKVTEWLGTGLPPHVGNYQKGFFNRYQDPTENRENLDALAAEFPNLVTPVNLPHLTNGYQRKSQAIMSGTGAIGSAPPAILGAPLLTTSGEITAAQPVAAIPFEGTNGQSIFATVDAIPSGETDFILRLRNPAGTIVTTIDTGFSPEFITRTLNATGTWTFEILGFQGDLGDYTFKVEPILVSAQQAQSGAVVLTANEWGHTGGDEVTAEFKNPGTANSPLSVAVTGKDLVVNLATDSTGALASTAAQVVEAINASAGATALLSATTFRGNTGAGIVQPRAKVNLDDFLNAPAHVQRGPFQQRVYRIGSVRDGSKVGVFLYCQQHAREWTTSLSCVETANQLVRNYAVDPHVKELLDNVEVFILANVNPDGGHYSFYDFNAQRRNMTNHCPATGASDPAARNAWGVDLNRNNSEYTLFDGYFGASTSCTSDVYSGPSEVSEPEIKNEHWVVDTFPNIKFANNVHSYGGYFMWAPGSYIGAGRVTAPAPNIGIEKYFFDAGEKVLARIKEHRGTVILPERTGPIADVLYSAAGNSADDQWYRKGIISYSFETGADRFTSTTTGTARIETGFQPCFAGVGTGGGTGSCPTSGALINEGRDQAMEFAAGNFGMVESAYDYAKDVTPPSASLEIDAVKATAPPINYRFNLDGEAAVIHYTTDGSEPTLSSPTYNNQRARGIGEVLTLSRIGIHDIKWFAVDIKGNRSATKTQRVIIGPEGEVSGTVPATLSLALSGPATFAPFTPGVDGTYDASTTANVISSAGDGVLSVSDPSATNTGKLVNGSFTLAQPLQASATSAAGTGAAFAPVGGSANPTSVLTYGGPTSNDQVTLNFRQAIGRTEALRTGAYSKTLTFTLSTTQP